MENNLQILVTANLNKGLSINEINRAIKSVEKSGLLRELNLKINIEKNLTGSLVGLNNALLQITKSMNLLNNAENKSSQSSKQASDSINKETEALTKQSQELQKNAEIRKRITTGQDKSERTSTTTGTKFNNTTTSQTITPTGKGNNDIIDHPVVQVINTGAIKEAEKALQSFTSDGSKRVDELSKHFGDADQRVKNLKNNLSNLTIDSSKLDFDKVTKQLRNLENTQKSQIGDLNKGQREAQKLASQIADARIAAQNEYSSLQAKQQKELVGNAYKEAELINKQFNLKKEYQKNTELVEAQAHKENLRRNTILGDARITDQKLAQTLATRQNREFDQNVLSQTKSYTDWWTKALKTKDTQEAQKTAASQRRAEKESNDYTTFWQKSLIDRDQKEQRFYAAQNKRISNNKTASTSILDENRSSYLTGQYDKIIQKMQQMQASGKALTQSDVDGINNRVQRLDNYRKAQVSIEDRTNKLNSIIASSERTASSFTGKFGAEKYKNSGIDNLLTQLKQLDPASKNAIEQANNLKNKISQIGAEANGASGKALTFGKALSTALTKFPVWMLATTAFYAPLHALQNGIGIVAELDAALTNLKKVTDETNITYSRFLETAHEIGNSIAGTTTDVVKSTTEWARLGYSIQQAQALAKQTLVYQNVGDLKSAEDASQSLISAIKGFGIEVDTEGKNITKIVDIYNEVGNKYAISSAGIGEAMRRSASSMFESGNTIEEAVALATAANSTIQDPARVGQMLKTVSMRLRGVSEDGEDLTNLIPSLEKKFQSMGLTLKKDDQTFKSTYEIFKDLSSVWNDLSDMKRADVLESVAGKLQGNLAASLINNFADAQNSLQTALNSTGSAARENETYIDSIAGRVALFQNAVEQFWSKSIDSSVIKGIIDLGTELVGVMGNLGNVVLVATGLFIAFKAKAILGLIESLGVAISALTSTSVAMNSVAIGTNGLTFSMIALQRAIPIALAVGALAAFVISMKQSTEATKLNIESIEEANKKYDDLSYKLKETENYYEQNYKSIQDNAEIKDKLFEMQTQLIDTYGQEAEGLDLVNGKYEEQIKTLSNLNKAKLENEIQESKIRVNAANAQKYHSPFVGETFKSVIGNVPLLGRVTDKNYSVMGDDGVGDLNVKQYYEELLRLKKAITDEDLKTLGFSEKLILTSEDWQKIQNAVKDKIAEISPLIEDQNNLLDKQKEKLKIDTFESLAPSIKLDNDQLEFFESINKLTSSLSLKDYSNNLESIVFWVSKLKSDKSNVSEVINKIKEYSTLKGNPEIIKSLNQFMEQSIQIRDSSENLKTLEDAMIALSKGISGSSNYMTAFMKIVLESKEEIDLLNKAQAELKENNFLSSATIQELSEKYEDFIKVTGLGTDAIYKFITAKKDEKNDVIKAEIEKTKVQIAETKKRIEALTDELNASIALLDINSLNSLNTEKLGMKALTSAKQVLSDLTTKYGILQNTLNDFNADSSSSKTNNDKVNDSYSDTVEILTDLQKALKEVKKLQSEEENRQKRMRQSDKAYQDSLKKTLELKKEELALLEQGGQNPSQLVSTKVQTTVKTPSDSSSTTVTSSAKNNTTTSSTNYSDLINKYANQYSIDPNLIAAIIKTESSFNTNATSSAGAAGLMQLMPGTAKGLGVKNSYDPEQNIAGGTKHFARLVKKYNGDIELALYAYNAGEGNVDKWIKNGKINNIPFKETKAYAPKVLSAYNGSISTYSTSSGNVSSSGVTTNKNGNTTIKTIAPTTSEIDKAAEQNVQDIDALKNEIYDYKLKILDSIKYVADNSVEEQQRLITASQKRQEKLDPTGEDFKKENNIQVNIQSKIQQIRNQESLELQKAIKEYGIQSDEYDKLIKQLQTERTDIQSEKYQKYVENINIGIDSSKERISDLENLIDQSQTKMSQYSEGTPEYNAQLNYQIELKKKQKKENDNLTSSLEKLIKSENLDAATKKNLKEVLDDIKKEDYSLAIKELNAQLIQSKKATLNKVILDLGHEIDISKAKMGQFKEGTAEYNAEAKIQVGLIKKQIEANQELIKFTEIQIKNEELTAAERAKYKEELNDLILANYEYAKSIKDINEQYADNVVENYKKMLQKQKDLELAALDEKIKAEEIRHNNVLKNYEDEMSKFEEDINARLKSMDRLNASEDHESELQKLLKEREKVQNKYNTILNNDSFEDKSKRKELLEQLAQIDEDITEKQKDRGREIAQQALQDQLEDRKDFIDKQITAENNGYDNRKEIYDKEKETLEKHWNSILEDETYFSDLKKQLMSDDAAVVESTLGTIRGKYDVFFEYLKSQATTLGSMFSTLNSNFQIDYKNLDGSPNSNSGSGNSASNNSSNNSNSNQTTDKTAIRDSAWKEYLNNKKRAEELGKEIQKGVSKSDEEAKRKQIANLSSINESYRKQYTFQDGSYNQLKDLKYYHEGGEAGVEGTTSKKWWNKILKSNEVPAILKKKEVVLDDPIEFINQLAGQIMGNLSSMVSPTKTSNGVSSGTIIENIHLTVTAPITNGYDFADELVSGLGRKGVRIGRR
ncbi:phage tail tape measure protein [Paenibacillus odorifer]|uniref:phage tail tape measure protein n=1 Tax=Paenibacillus odorifer TaxID=189426 RepID=UPI0009701116|nr:phage tail tape measure protein [Paenibacillus odorifer]OME55374.1 phage tail tape measure protein [Paenibacillus odorifer]